MTISMDRLLAHMAWANQQIISKLNELPDEALKAYVVNPEWTVAEILRHILSSADWLGSHLTGEPKSVFTRPISMREMDEFLKKAAIFDDRLLRASAVPDGEVTYEANGKYVTHIRSTILSQAIHHATEHRAQLVSALELRGFTNINLDHLSMWGFEANIKK